METFLILRSRNSKQNWPRNLKGIFLWVTWGTHQSCRVYFGLQINVKQKAFQNIDFLPGIITSVIAWTCAVRTHWLPGRDQKINAKKCRTLWNLGIWKIKNQPQMDANERRMWMTGKNQIHQGSRVSGNCSMLRHQLCMADSRGIADAHRNSSQSIA